MKRIKLQEILDKFTPHRDFILEAMEALQKLRFMPNAGAGSGSFTLALGYGGLAKSDQLIELDMAGTFIDWDFCKSGVSIDFRGGDKLKICMPAGSQLLNVPAESFFYSSDNTIFDTLGRSGIGCCVWTQVTGPPYPYPQGQSGGIRIKEECRIEVREYAHLFIDYDSRVYLRSHMGG